MTRPATWRHAAMAGAILLAATLAHPARAQIEVDTDLPVSLVADEIIYDSEAGRVTATGSVEVYYGERTLTAERIVYDDRTGRIEAEGDLVLRDPAGTTVFADFADLDAELRDGIVLGAQSVLAENVKLAAVEARRVEGRYNTLSKVVYSPCEVCPEDPTPLWRIRARRVIHDEVENIVHYENATFDVLGVPIVWLPYFRHPDPTVERASGFLVPAFRSSSIFGYGLQVPYYWVIDPHSDLTFTPFLTTNDGLILGAEYRRIFTDGALSLSGSLTYDDYEGEGALHGHLDTHGRFDIGAGIDAGWDIAFASDDGYLRRYEFEYADRLTSEIFVERYERDHFFDVSGVFFQSLRDNDPSGQIPIVLPIMEARWQTPEPLLGGELGLFSSGYMLNRDNGPDASRFTLGADWEREEILPSGLAVTGFAQVRGDLFSASDDPAIADSPATRVTGHFGTTLRYPLIWEPEGGATHVLEPVVQGIFAPWGHNDPTLRSEDSLVTEFDENNVIDRNHFSGLDAFEEGPRVNVLLRYDVLTDAGLRLDAAVGRVFRFDEVPAFSAGSGLRDTESDFVTAWQASYDPHVVVRHRMRFDDDGTLTRNELYGGLDLDPVELTVSYASFESDPQVGAPLDREEISATGSLLIDRNWSVSGFAQRDLELGEYVLVGGQLTWENECAAVDVYLRRRFTETEDAPASTSIGVNVRLLTLGTLDVGQEERGRGLFDFGGFGCG